MVSFLSNYQEILFIVTETICSTFFCNYLTDDLTHVSSDSLLVLPRYRRESWVHMLLCWEKEHASLRKQTCTPDHCEHWPVPWGDPWYLRVTCDTSSTPTRFPRPLGRQRLTEAEKPHSEGPGGKYLLTPVLVFVKRCQNMDADSIIRTRLLKPPAPAMPSGASLLAGPSLFARRGWIGLWTCTTLEKFLQFCSVRSGRSLAVRTCELRDQ